MSARRFKLRTRHKVALVLWVLPKLVVYMLGLMFMWAAIPFVVFMGERVNQAYGVAVDALMSDCDATLEATKAFVKKHEIKDPQ